MTIINLSIPIIIQGTKQSVEYYPKNIDLNEGYQQLTGNSEHKITWTLVSDLTEYALIQQWTDFLDGFDGANLFSIFLCDELGTKVLYCDSYSIIYSTVTKGQLTMECTESADFEDTSLLNYLGTETIPYALVKAYEYMTRFSGNLNTGGYSYFGYPEVLPSVYVHPNENNHSGALTQINNLQINGGQQAYPDVCGTVETAFLNILALCEASQIVGDASMKTYASGIATAMILGASYRSVGNGVPNPPNAFRFLPHWLFAVKDNAPVKKMPTDVPMFFGGQSPLNDTQGQGLWSLVTFTQVGSTNVWRAQMPVTLDCVYKVIGFTATQAGQTETKNVLTRVINGIELPINYWIDKNNRHCFYYNIQMLERGVNSITGDMPGQLFITAPVGFNGLARVVHTVFENTPVTKGFAISTNPFWRTTNGTEFTVDLSSIKYVWQGYNALADDPVFQRARDATQISVENAIANMANTINIFHDVDRNNVYDTDGLNLIHVNNRDGSIKKTDPYNVVVTQAEDTNNNSSLIVQQAYNRIIWTESTTFTTTIASNLDPIYISQFLEVKFDVDVNGTIVVYKYAIPMAYNNQSPSYVSLTYKDLLTWGESNWYASYRNDPIFNFSNGNGTQNFYWEQQDVGDGNNLPIVFRAVMHSYDNPNIQGNGQFYLTPRRPWGNNIPRFLYKLRNGNIQLKIFDNNNQLFTKVLTPNNAWAISILEWDDLTPNVAGTIPALPVKYVGFVSVSVDVEISLYWVGEAPKPIPIPQESQRTYIENKIRFAHTWYIGGTVVANNGANVLPYTPGILPYQVTVDGTKRPRFNGQVHTGFQTYRLWQLWNRPLNQSLILQYLIQASEIFTNRSPIQQKGLFMPLYALGLSDLVPQNKISGFYELYGQNFPEWTIAPEPLSMIWTLKLVADLAESWRNEPTNADLERLVMNYISAINDFWLTYGTPGRVPNIVIQSESTTPMLITDNYFLEGTALLLSIAIDANIVGRNRLLTFKTIDKCYKYLKANEQTVGVMSGSWTFNAPDVVCNGVTYKKYRTDAHAHIMRAYAKLYKERGNLKFPTNQEWVTSNA